jgi:hypothetical protein
MLYLIKTFPTLEEVNGDIPQAHEQAAFPDGLHVLQHQGTWMVTSATLPNSLRSVRKYIELNIYTGLEGQ